MIIGNKNSNHGILVDSVSISTTRQVRTIYDMTTKKRPSLVLKYTSRPLLIYVVGNAAHCGTPLKEAFPENEWYY
jgi:hypothetical protein